MHNKNASIVLLFLALIFRGEIVTAQNDGTIKRSGLCSYTYSSESGPFKQFEKLYMIDETTSELYLKYLQTRRTQRIINYSCVGAFVGVGCTVGILALNPYNTDHVLNLIFPWYAITIASGVTALITNAIIIPLQSSRKKRIISGVNNRILGMTKFEKPIKLALVFTGLQVGLELSF